MNQEPLDELSDPELWKQIHLEPVGHNGRAWRGGGGAFDIYEARCRAGRGLVFPSVNTVIIADQLNSYNWVEEHGWRGWWSVPGFL